MLIADKEEQQRRKNICDSCEFKKGALCGVCMCLLFNIRKLYIKQCPKNKF